jgi:hypothetical protein
MRICIRDPDFFLIWIRDTKIRIRDLTFRIRNIDSHCLFHAEGHQWDGVVAEGGFELGRLCRQIRPPVT